jgi:6-phosphogluconolactonase/glucosamine-6-phosphate isomerase/deaminase
MKELSAGPVLIRIYDDERTMGQEAAAQVVAEVQRAGANGLTPVLWLMAAPSGFAVYEGLIERAEASERVARALAGLEMYQFDDYPIDRKSPRFPVTFRHLLEERLVTPLRQRAGVTVSWHPLELVADRDADEVTMTDYQRALEGVLQSPAHHVIEVKGIGMDGHWGFHGAETPLDDPPRIMRVPMNEENVAQQMLDWPEYFRTPSDVPVDAVSCNVELFLQADTIIDVVPQTAKEYSVLAAYATDEIIPAVPSSALKTHDNAAAYLTGDAAAALLEYRAGREKGEQAPLSAETVRRLQRIWQDPNRPERARKSIELMMDVLRELGLGE